eukprot:13773480-Ditylum_brightwellii.AAC.2
MNLSVYEATMLAKLPLKALTKVMKDPNCVELSKLRHEVYQNFPAVHSSQNVNKGHLGLDMLATQYAMRIGVVAYVVSPTHPGTYDPNITANSGRVVQSCREAKHKQLIEDHMIENAVFQVSKNQLEKALTKWLLSKIEDFDTGLNTISLQDIFDHAYNCRGQIDNDLVYECASTFNARIDMSQGFNTYVKHQEECRDFFRDAQQPITDQQLASKGQLYIGQTGLLQKKYLTWKCCTIAT